MIPLKTKPNGDEYLAYLVQNAVFGYGKPSVPLVKAVFL